MAFVACLCVGGSYIADPERPITRRIRRTKSDHIEMNTLCYVYGYGYRTDHTVQVRDEVKW